MGAISLKYKSKSGNLTAPGDVDPGAMIPLATISVGAGGASSIDFTSIPSVYQHLQIRAIARSNRASANDSMKMTFNSDTTNNYAFHYLYGDGSTAVGDGTANYSSIALLEAAGNNATSGIFGVSIIDILDYSNTSKYKTTRNLGGDDRNGSGLVSLTSGLWQNTNAITTISIIPFTGTSFLQYSHFALYGIKRAGA